MRLRAHVVRLVDRDVWQSAREVLPEHRSVLVELGVPGVSGWGEAPAYRVDVHRSGLGTVLGALRRVRTLVTRLDPTDPEGNWARLRPELADCPFALSALDVAGHDLAARLAGVPLHTRLGLPDSTGLRSSYSIGLAEPEVMVAKLRKAPGWAPYKVKLRSPADLPLLRALREHTDAPFWLDGNACWEPGELLPVLGQLADLGVVALEQPFAAHAWAATAQARRHSPVPVVADESATTPEEVARAAEAFDGINVKVLKVGGITPALRMLRMGRDLGLTTMVGCLPESTAGAGAAAHLAAVADHVDLDTVALLATDTGTGFTLDGQGRIVLADAPGTGFVPVDGPAWVVRRDRAGEVRLVIDGVVLGWARRDPGGTSVVEVDGAVRGQGYEAVLLDGLTDDEDE